ncbi:hypothetical protein CERSUDRAFT_123570 [Gelatoporia subvermispora B]|uniref:DUF6533 domain-containing protein n=1 Tax=Ceriporiopsis subvermispora (strain B) TaxID=914234 RepID=M2QKX7_CERS8|nr:hypothetical protein CERSUDRAFT_123570 [Gelatoporia subvermispora B]
MTDSQIVTRVFSLSSMKGHRSHLPKAILYFDYCLTLSTEIERFWRRDISWAFLLYAANRYLALLGSIPVAVEFFGIMPQSRCRSLQTYHQYVSVATQVLVAALLTMRTYALYRRSKLVLSMIVFILVTGTGVVIWSVASEKSLPTGSSLFLLRIGCDLSLSQAHAVHLAAAWGAMLVFDSLIFILTLISTVKSGMLWKGSLFRIMLRDGAIYFGTIVLSNVINILAFVLPAAEAKGMCTTLANVISSTLVSRLMLNLRDPKRGQTTLGYMASMSVQRSTTAAQMTAIEEGFQSSESDLDDDLLSIPSPRLENAPTTMMAVMVPLPVHIPGTISEARL